jgi:pre-mRNA-processing factor 6
MRSADYRLLTYLKLWMMMGQIAEQLGEVDVAREAFAKGLKQCHDSIPLWTLSAQLEDKAGMFSAVLWPGSSLAGSTIKARAILEKARQRIPANDQLWFAPHRAPATCRLTS